jgi:cell division protein FtsB
MYQSRQSRLQSNFITTLRRENQKLKDENKRLKQELEELRNGQGRFKKTGASW